MPRAMPKSGLMLREMLGTKTRALLGVTWHEVVRVLLWAMMGTMPTQEVVNMPRVAKSISLGATMRVMPAIESGTMPGVGMAMKPTPLLVVDSSRG